MISFALAVSLVAIVLPSPGNSLQEARFFLCPSYREIDSAADRDGQSVPYRNPTGRNDPLWLLEKEDEWIPFRALVEQEQRIPSQEESHQPKTFRCIFYYLAALSHFMLDLFTPSVPVYVYPYYRVALLPDENVYPKSPSTDSVSSPPKPLTS